ncbi:MAG TPA: TIGR00304 family protein [Methanothermococcus okinawensis]|uniref:TIGR00304 family protein n=1 Tax=Methanothermococcus okinawensis TaxID=155863 RepID=A0A832ZZT6_9EURY|nr:TIGR00304 family protein [Methanothermococcus okinawensis]
MDRLILVHLGIFLIVIGFFLVSFGVISYGLQNKDKTEDEENRVSFSGIIMIGPIPILIGNSPTLAILSILILILMMLWVYLFYMRI